MKLCFRVRMSKYLRILAHNGKTDKSLEDSVVHPIMHGGRGENLPPSCRIFFNNFFSLKLRTWNFLTLSFYSLDTMWRNFIKKYWFVNKLWHFCHQWQGNLRRKIFFLTNICQRFLLAVFSFILFPYFS